MSDQSTWIWLIPLLPLLASMVTAVFGPAQLKHRSHWPVIIGIALSAVLSLVALSIGPGEDHVAVIKGYDWLQVGSLQSLISSLVDPLSLIMLVTVSLIATLVAVYSSGYMAGDRGYARYFAFIGLFAFSMLMLVLADNFLMLYIFWEAVGLCSYLLIGFYYQRPAAAAAAKKAFLVNRIGDFGFAIGILLIYLNFGTVNFQQVFALVPQVAENDPGLITLISLCLFAGATGKSAQLPLYVWLPDAMEGPSPVSALIHAATMVTAGVYMVVRCGALFVASPVALTIVAVVGGLTAFFAATIALAQTDIKRILAYSTISQLGYMFLAVGVGAASAGIFHLYTHAFFKALLFLAAGSIMHAMHDHIDLKDIGGLRKDIPFTFWTFLVGALALAGCPGLSGFFSKDEILAASLNHPSLSILGWLAVLTAGLTAFYTFRCFFLAFFGPRKIPSDVEHPHETPVMNYVLIALAVGALLAGYVHFGGEHGVLHDFLGDSRSVAAFEHGDTSHHDAAAVDMYAGETDHAAHGLSHKLVMAISVGVFAIGIGLAWLLYRNGRDQAMMMSETIFSVPNKILANKYYVDEAYHRVIVRPLQNIGHFCFGSDNYLIDSLLWVITAVPRLLGWLFGLLHRGNLQGYAFMMLLSLAIIFIFVMRAI